MWSLIKLVLLFIIATVVHWAFASVFSYWGLSVNMILAFTAAFCSVLRPSFGYPVAFFCGLFLDFFGTKLFGNNAFTFTVAACIVYDLSDRFDFDAVPPQMVTVFALTFVCGALNSLLFWWFASTDMWPGWWSLIGGSLVTAVFAPAVFGLVRLVMGKDLSRQA